MLDLLIKNGMIADGTGRPAFAGTVAVKDGKIAGVYEAEGNRIGRTSAGGLLGESGAPGPAPWGGPFGESAAVVDAQGLLVAPGFIDIHRHGDLTPFSDRPEGEELRQGITTFVNGNCGFSAAPSSGEYFDLLKDYARPIMGTIPDGLRGLSQAEFLRRAAAGKLYSDMGYLVGNGALRIAVKGFDASPMTEGELGAVCGLLRESLEAGALGLSLGLMYVPENFYSFRELEQICRVAARMGRIVTAHIRGEGSSLLASVGEIVDLARSCGGSFHISHLKAAGRKNWHTQIAQVLELISRARAEGLDVSFDLYPYCAGSTAMYTLLPPRLMEGGMGRTLKRLADPQTRAQLETELREEQRDWDNLVASTGWDAVVLVGGNCPGHIGRSVAEIAAERGCSPELCMMDLMLENEGDLPIVFHSMCREDMEQVLKSRDSIVISDGLYSEGGIPHPRRYGSFAHLIARYGGELGLEQAVRKITANPAARLGLEDRGRIAAGLKADLVLLDLQRFRDTATYEDPVHYPEGIPMVIVGGHIACENGKPTGGFYGKMVRGRDVGVL